MRKPMVTNYQIAASLGKKTLKALGYVAAGAVAFPTLSRKKFDFIKDPTEAILASVMGGIIGVGECMLYSVASLPFYELSPKTLVTTIATVVGCQMASGAYELTRALYAHEKKNLETVAGNVGYKKTYDMPLASLESKVTSGEQPLLEVMSFSRSYDVPRALQEIGATIAANGYTLHKYSASESTQSGSFVHIVDKYRFAEDGTPVPIGALYLEKETIRLAAYNPLYTPSLLVLAEDIVAQNETLTPSGIAEQAEKMTATHKVKETSSTNKRPQKNPLTN